MNHFYAVHIGLGAFHRAHQLYYFNELLKTTNKSKASPTWHYISATIRSNKTLIDHLNQQNCRYTLLEEDDSHLICNQIHALEKALFAGEGKSHALIDYIANTSTKIITYTVTEKGYYANLSDNTFQIDHIDIIHDINNKKSPKTAIGVTVWGLYKRYTSHQKGITLISCDNLPNNGKILRQAILSFAQKINSEFSAWIKTHCTFPSSMVDRIVPAVTDKDLKKVHAHIDYIDLVPVITEKFSQWVIENNFASDKPPLESVGVQFVDDVSPFESMKLTMLNGAHSLIAYLGSLAGFKTVCDAINNPLIYNLIHYYMTTVAAPLVKRLPKEVSLMEYRNQLLKRFKNPHLAHQTEQIAADGSQKIPQRWLHNLCQLIDKQQNYDLYALGIAAWIIFTQGYDDHGNILMVNDPLKHQFGFFDNPYTNAYQIVEHYFALDKVFSSSLRENIALKEKVLNYIKSIKQQGTLSCIQDLLENISTTRELIKVKQ
ncbi:mannitol dehydrogenase family protein [Cysteiniphilum halobium]|uniref:mannitol dehydrogenase family protein n=1 Tax=Cysteiniphilum halobium TaxID=2219059 RepID=UPI000E655008|nr:mannitol dehydrogenase family protein [Cysteiniphilum halobium]